MTSPPAPSEIDVERQRWRNLLAAVATVTIFGFALGEMFPLLSLIMERDGVSADVIGVNTAMQPAGILLAGFVVPPLVRRYGAKAVVLSAACLVAAIILAYPFTPIFWGWFGLRLVQGLAVSTLFSISEAWIVQSADGAYRTRVVAIYTSILAVSFGLGPALIAATGIDTVVPFVIGAIVLVVATLPVLSFSEPPPGEEGGEGVSSFLGFARKAPVLLLAVGVYAVFDAASLGFLPVYALKRGLDQSTAALTLTIMVLGNVVLQFPIGWLGDHAPKRLVMAGCGLATAAFAALLPVSVGTPWMWLVLIVLGAASAGIYTIALAELGERFAGHELVTGTAAMSTSWGVGALVGALLSGGLIGRFGPDGFPYGMALVFALFLMAMALRDLQKRRRGAAG